MLHLTTMPGAWPQWLNQVGHPELPDGQRGRFFDSMLLALDAAVVGLGLVLCAEPFCQQYLEHGRLIAPYALRWRRKNGQSAKVGSTSMKDGLYDWQTEAVFG